MQLRYRLARWFIGPLVRLYLKECSGLEQFPSTGGVVVAANHNSLADDLALAYLYILARGDGRATAVARLKPLKDSKVDRFLMRIIAQVTNFFFPIINSHEHNKIERAVRALNQGICFINHPEGRVNTDSKVMLKGRTGTARIALLAKAPILPIGLIGTEYVLPLNAHLPRFRRMSVRVGKPMMFEEFYGKEDDIEVLEEVTRQVMKEIGRLSGRTYPH